MDNLGNPINLVRSSTDFRFSPARVFMDNNRFEDGSAVIGNSAPTIAIPMVTSNTNTEAFFPNHNITGLQFALTNSLNNNTINNTFSEIERVSPTNFRCPLNLNAGQVLDNTFVGGTISVDGGNTVQVTNVNVAANQITTTRILIPFKLRDDDYNLPLTNNLPYALNLATTINTYRKVYINVINDEGGSPGSNQNNIPFIDNEEPYTSARVFRTYILHRQARLNGQRHFWATYYASPQNSSQCLSW